MNEFKDLLSNANLFLEQHPIPWEHANNELKTIAMALLVDRGLVPDAEAFSDRHGILQRAIDPTRVIGTLSQAHVWWRYQPKQAETVVKDIGATLKMCGYKDKRLATQRVVGFYEIETKKEAAEISSALEALSADKQLNTGLFKGLLGCLCSWNQYQAYGAASPEELKALRKNKDLTQCEAARRLGITHRQYCRHEAGESPISEDRFKTLKDIEGPFGSKT